MKLLKTILVFSLFVSVGCFNTTEENTRQSVNSQQDEDYKVGESYY